VSGADGLSGKYAAAGDRAEHQLLVQLGGASADCAINKVPVVGLQVARGLDVSRTYGGTESGRVRLYAFLDPLGLGIELAAP
jgi:hypothetical protein